MAFQAILQKDFFITFYTIEGLLPVLCCDSLNDMSIRMYVCCVCCLKSNANACIV